MAFGEDDVTIGIGAKVDQATAAINDLKQQMGSLVQQVQQLNNAMDDAGSRGMLTFHNSLADGTVKLGLFLGSLKEVWSTMKDLAGLALAPINWAIGGAQALYPYAQQGVQQSFDLAATTNSTLFGWGYMFGAPNQQGYDTSGRASSLYNWFNKASLTMPFARQDLMAAATMMSQMPINSAGDTMGIGDIEKYLPLISDLAATKGAAAYGGRGLTAQQASYAILEALFGRTVMLKRDLFINPNELLKYGLDATGSGMGMHINDPSTLLPALEAYAQAHHLVGAGAAATRVTWRGALSNLVDRLQNFGTEVGGIAPADDPAHGITAGSIRPGSMFDRMLKSLNGLSDWLGDPGHQQQVMHWADLFQNVLGGGVQVASNVFQGFIGGLKDSGALDWLGSTLGGIGKWLNDPGTVAGLQQIGDTLGKLLGPAAQTIGGGIQGFLDGISKSDAGQKIGQLLTNLGTWFSDPQHQKDVKAFFDGMGQDIGNLIGQLSDLLGQLGNVSTWIGQKADQANNGQGLIGGLYQWGLQRNVDSMSADQQAWDASFNPFQEPLGEGMPFASYQTMVEEAKWVTLMHQYNDDDKTQAAYNQWLQQQAQLAGVDPTTGQPLPGAGPLGASMMAQQIAKLTGGGAGPGFTSGASAIATVKALYGNIGTYIGDLFHGFTPTMVTGHAADVSGVNPTASPQAYTTAGQQSAQTYLTSFSTTLTQNSQSQVVEPFTSQLELQVRQSNAGGRVATALMATVSQLVQQAVADALKNWDQQAHGATYAPGGYRGTPGVGYY